MRWKKIAKVLLIVVLAVAGLAFAAFWTFVYNPFEGTVDEIRRAVPADVDFYVAKRALSRDFVEFPEPVFWRDVTEMPSWSRLSSGKFFRSLKADVGPALAQLEDLQAQLAAVPVVGLDILGDMVGSDVVLAGKLRASGQGFAWAAYTRASWKIRAGIALLDYPFVQARLGAAKVTDTGAGIFQIVAPRAEPMFLTRIKDLVILGNAKELVAASRAQMLGDSDRDPMHASADYNDQLITPLAEWSKRVGVDVPNAVESMVDASMLRKWLPEFATWPRAGSDTTKEQRLLKLFMSQPAMRRLWASVVFEEDSACTLLAQLNVNPGQLTDFQRRFHDEKAGDVQHWLRRFLGHVPATAAFAAALRVPPGHFLTELIQVLDRDTQELIRDGLKLAGENQGLEGMIERFAPGLEPWVGIVFRNNDYPAIEKEFKVPIPSPAPAWALIFRSLPGETGRMKKLIDVFRKKLRQHIGFEGGEYNMLAGPGNQVKISEWGNPHIEGTGEIAVLFDDDDLRRNFMVSNSGKLMREVVMARYGQQRSILGEDQVAAVLDQSPSTLSGFAWLDGPRCSDIVAKYQEFTRRQSRSEAPDPAWAATVRPRIEDEIFRREFRARYRDKAQLRGADSRRFEELIGRRLDALWPAERQKLGRGVDIQFSEAMSWLEYLHSACLELRARPKDLRVEARLFFTF